MLKGFIVLPDQLFQRVDIDRAHAIFLVEDRRFFSDFAFHKAKLVFHRASMKYYAAYLKRKNYRVTYLDHGQVSGEGSLANRLAEKGISEVCMYDPVDHLLKKRLQKEFRSAGIKCSFLETHLFICTSDCVSQMLTDKKHYSMNSFYISQRKRLGILLDGDKPVGGKWSFDKQNRQRLDKKIDIPSFKSTRKNEYIKEACKYVQKNFADNPGQPDGFIFPVTHAVAKKRLEEFITERLDLFGTYEDAICADERFLFHSALSPLINSGLLLPGEVVDAVIDYAKSYQVRLNSVEGFIRQVIGWREFMRGVYLLEGEKMSRANFWGFKKKLPQCFYNATTGIAPVDVVISAVMKNAYAHHIERLMVLGNFMLLCEIDPKEVYRWFMEMFIDAYDWVMVPNVYGMSQYAAGNLITTKPYISSSNYILKMSDFKRGDWCDIWDSLFWRFIAKHKKVFAKNPRMKMMAVMLDRMDKRKLNAYIDKAEEYLARLF